MGSVWYRYMSLMTQVQSCTNVTKVMKKSLTLLVQEADEQNRFSQPMFWIGIYVALASLVCILLLLADGVLGLLRVKLWIPSKYFPLNAVSLSLIAIAMKLPMDLNNPMSGVDDQVTKIGSMAFMCTIMANLLPSLSTMDSKGLFTNVTALGVLVITLVANVCIQINTGVISYLKLGESHLPSAHLLYILVAIFYVGMLLMLLMMYICSSLAILKSKQILESKYQTCHQTSLQIQQSGRLITVEKLKQHVRNYWIMTTTGNPQFMTSNSITTSASGVISTISTIVYLVIVIQTGGKSPSKREYKSDYKWSIGLIFFIQGYGIISCSMVPIYRCCRVNSGWSREGILNDIKVFKVESYWTDKLSEWKKTGIPFPFRNLRCKIVIEKLKFLILSICIGFQKAVVVACKIIGLVPVFIMTCILLTVKGSKALGIVLGSRKQQTDLSQDDASLQDNMEITHYALIGLSLSLKTLIKKAEKRRPKNLMELLRKYEGFEKVGNVNIHHFPSLLGQEIVDYWSLTVVNLTAIAISLPNVQQNIVDSLLRSVSEGLVYVTRVEESLNATDHDYVSTQKAAKRLWLEVEVYKKWLGNKLQNLAPQGNTTRSILQWFMNTSQSMVNANDVESMEIDFNCRSISAHSMYRITETILFSNIDEVSPEELFTRISSTISDILVACLISLPQVIQIKCQESAPEKREASVHSAAELLGETMQIIQRLQDRELPPSDLDGLSFFSRWRAYLWSSSMRIWIMLFSWGT